MSDLDRCLVSILDSRLPPAVGNLGIMIVDDGDLPGEMVERFAKRFESRGWEWCYVRKKFNRGLFYSRLLAIDRAGADVILFLDDDVEIGSEYLCNLVTIYEADAAVCGVGGVDELFGRLKPLHRYYGRLFLYDSGDPRKLSRACGSWSSQYWAEQSVAFETEFLSGCNMSFRVNSVKGIICPSWLGGYSLGEDIYLSLHAREAGTLIISPELRVRHHTSPRGREAVQGVSYMRAVNRYRLVQVHGVGGGDCIAFWWWAVGHLVKIVVVRVSWSELSGFIEGLYEIARGVHGKLDNAKTRAERSAARLKARKGPRC